MVSRRHSFRTMKNPTMKNNSGLFLEVALSQHCFLLLSLLTLFFFSYWLLIHLEMKLCESWLNHEPLSLSARFCLLFERIKFSDFLLVWFWFCFAFYPRTFFRSGALYDDEMNWFSVTTFIQCKQKMLSSSNRVREKSLGSQWLTMIMQPWRLINFY